MSTPEDCLSHIEARLTTIKSSLNIKGKSTFIVSSQDIQQNSSLIEEINPTEDPNDSAKWLGIVGVLSRQTQL
ncbi:MAG: hypothetical protein RLZ35_556 [Pseudomonadota bacterium]|jgi:hypothetical protein